MLNLNPPCSLSNLAGGAFLNWVLSTVIFPVSPEFSAGNENADVDAVSPSYSLRE
jgi:hypothetical protein